MKATWTVIDPAPIAFHDITMLYGFSLTSRRVMERAHAEAASRGYTNLCAAHILVAIAESSGSAAAALDALEVDRIELIAICRGHAPLLGGTSQGALPFDDDARAMLLGSPDAIERTGHKTVFSAHLLDALFRAGGQGRALLALVGIDLPALEQAVDDALIDAASELEGDHDDHAD
jgi:ATP-dependent Clp protease ATP-binding subunit ClpA